MDWTEKVPGRPQKVIAISQRYDFMTGLQDEPLSVKMTSTLKSL